MRIRLDVSIDADANEGYGQLRLAETIDVGKLSTFAEIAAVLSAFHDVAEGIKRAREVS